jgi:hypothetical protein
MALNSPIAILTFAQVELSPEHIPDRSSARASNRSDALSFHRLLSARKFPGSLPKRE